MILLLTYAFPCVAQSFKVIVSVCIHLLFQYTKVNLLHWTIIWTSRRMTIVKMPLQEENILQHTAHGRERQGML